MSPIANLRLENFKSIRKGGIEFGNVTALIGPNGSGKSSFIQALEILKQSAGKEGILLRGDLVDLGSFQDVASSQVTNPQITIRLSGSRKLSRPFTTIQAVEVDFFYAVSFKRDDIIRIDGKLATDGVTFAGSWDRGQYQLTDRPDRYGDKATLDVGVQRTIGQPFRIQVRGFNQIPPDQSERTVEEISEIASAIETTIRDCYFVPANRGLDLRAYPLVGTLRPNIASAEGVTDQGRMVASTMVYRAELEELISSWSERITGVRLKHRVLEGIQASIEAKTPKLSTNIVNEGFGTNQLILLLLQLADAPEQSLIAIEEPEIHLHPSPSRVGPYTRRSCDRTRKTNPAHNAQ